MSGAIRTLPVMSETLIGYARCSTDAQDLTAQRDRLSELGVPEQRIYLDHGLTGTNRNRPGLDQALAAVRAGDTLVVPKLDRLARSVPDARAIGDDLAARGVKLSLGGQVYDPADPMGKMFFSILATFAEFEVDLLRMRTCEGMAVARDFGCSPTTVTRHGIGGLRPARPNARRAHAAMSGPKRAHCCTLTRLSCPSLTGPATGRTATAAMPPKTRSPSHRRSGARPSGCASRAAARSRRS
jgi:DNA invertase Pin-like site-specific DNA recombinase